MFWLLFTSLNDGTIVGQSLRSGERVMVIVTTPAPDPRRTKIMSLTHQVSLAQLGKKFAEL